MFILILLYYYIDDYSYYYIDDSSYYYTTT